MDRTIEPRVAALMSVYARYFVEDFTAAVVNHLSATFTKNQFVALDYIGPFVEQTLAEHPISIENENAPSRFICECACFAIERGATDPESRATYDRIRALPSIHHNEICEIIFAAAQLYLRTVQNTIIGVVLNDAGQAAEKIMLDTKTRVSNVQTGGSLHQFNWGILSDGLWLNAALLRAFDLAKVFRPGTEVVSYYATTAFEVARQYSNSPVFDAEDRQVVRAALDQLLSQVDETKLGALVSPDTPLNLANLMFGSSSLTFAMDQWEKGLSKPDILIESVSQLSEIAEGIRYLKLYLSSSSDEDAIHGAVITRLDELDKVVTLCLVAFEAVRETKYAEALILVVKAPTEDPLVDVYVNSDVLPLFLSSGGSETDLVKIGNYLDPRKGGFIPSKGQSLDWVLERKDDIVASVTSSEDELIAALRVNDSIVIQELATSAITNVVMSYREARGISDDIEQALKRRIYEIGLRCAGTQSNTAWSLVGAIAELLVETIGDAFLTEAFGIFSSYANVQDPAAVATTPARTIIALAVKDAISFFQGEMTV